MGTQQDEDLLARLQQAYPVNPVMLHCMVTEACGTTDAPVADTPVAEEPMLIQPASADDYFRQQGIEVSSELPDKNDINEVKAPQPELHAGQAIEDDKEKSLMVVMSFTEWLKHISSKNLKAKEEEAEQKALKAMWQQQKLAAAIEEESDEIPEQVFEMAVNSISRKDELLSESLAEVYAKQGKKEKAIEMYRKLSLLNPEKNTYFAARIEKLQKDL